MEKKRYKLHMFLIFLGLTIIFIGVNQNISETNFDYLREMENSSEIVVLPFEDQYFKPLLTSFKLGHSHSLISKTSFRSGTIPTFLLIARDRVYHAFWQQQLLHISSGQCPLPCNFTEDKSKVDEVDAVVFFLRDIKSKSHMVEGFPTDRDLSQPWVMLSLEAALRANSMYGTPFTEWNGVFNRTMMHRTDADVFTPHGFVVSNEDMPLLPSNWVIPPPDLSKKFNKSIASFKLAVAFISNCNAESGRLEYITEMKKYVDLDVYGACGDLKCGGSRYVEHAYKVNKDECFQNAGQNYLFYFAFENSICKDYVTEKLYNLLYYPIVPIVLGGAAYKNIMPHHSYIDAADFSPKKLASYLLFLKDHPEKYNEYFTWRSFYKPSTIGGIVSMCDLCAKLHDSSFYEYNVYENFYKWIYLDSECNRGWINGRVDVVKNKI